MYIIGVVGPSEIPNDLVLVSQLHSAIELAIFGADEVVSGGADGIDTFTKEICVGSGRRFREITPKHNHWNGKSRYCPTPDSCYGFEARNMDIAKAVDKLVCVSYNLEGYVGEVCYHCKKRLDVTLVTHKVSGGCWTLDYAEKLGKDVELIEI